MAKKRPSIGNVLQGRAEPAGVVAPEAPVAPEVGPVGERTTVAQRGKRANAEYAQLSAPIPRSLRARFKAKVALEETNISAKLEELIRQYVDDE